MVFSEFRRRFDVLAPHLTKKHGRNYIVVDERRVGRSPWLSLGGQIQGNQRGCLPALQAVTGTSLRESRGSLSLGSCFHQLDPKAFPMSPPKRGLRRMAWKVFC